MQLFVFIVFLVISLSFAKPQPSRARFILTVGYRERAVLQLRAGSDSVTDSNIHKIPANVDRCTSRPLEVIAKRLVVGTLFLAWYILKYVAHFHTIVVTLLLDPLKPEPHLPFFALQAWVTIS